MFKKLLIAAVAAALALPLGGIIVGDEAQAGVVQGDETYGVVLGD